MEQNKIADAIELSFGSNSTDERNVVDALFAIANSIEKLASAVNRLGTNDAATNMGAIELLAMEVKNAGESIAGAIENTSMNLVE